MDRPRLELQRVACGYDPARPILRDITIEVRGSQTVVLVGPSGCGKTTLLKTALGLIRPIDGRVRVLGHEPPARPPRGAVGYIPQGLGLVRNLTVERNVLLGTLPRLGALPSLAGAFPAAACRAAAEALDRVGLADKARQRPIHLSGGERRRVAIARALVQRPELLLADEILSELDVRSADLVLEAVRLVQRDTRMGILLVEHDLDTAWELADVLCCLGKGSLQRTLSRPADGPEALREALQVEA